MSWVLEEAGVVDGGAGVVAVAVVVWAAGAAGAAG